MPTFILPKAKESNTFSLPKTKTPKEEPSQKFFISNTDKSISISYEQSKFGISQNTNNFKKYDSFMSNTNNKDNDNIQKIITFIKYLAKSNISFNDISTRLSPSLNSQSIKIFLNNISKPPTQI